jgi:hypothetical protein
VTGRLEVKLDRVLAHPEGTTAGRSVAVVITDSVINYPKTCIEENLSQRKI